MLVEDPDKRDHESLLWKADPTARLDQVARGEVCWIGSTWDERDLLRSDPVALLDYLFEPGRDGNHRMGEPTIQPFCCENRDIPQPPDTSPLLSVGIAVHFQ